MIHRTARENPTWGAPRIVSELRLLGHAVAEATVAKYRPKGRQPPSQNGKTFLQNHIGCLVSGDFFTMPTATFQVLYGFVLLAPDRRRVLHFNLTPHPTAAWVGRPVRQAFPFDTAPRFLIRDRDAISGKGVWETIRNLGIEEVVTAPRSPWQNPLAERLIGTLRREGLDHVTVLNEAHLKRILSGFLDFYHAKVC